MIKVILKTFSTATNKTSMTTVFSSAIDTPEMLRSAMDYAVNYTNNVVHLDCSYARLFVYRVGEDGVKTRVCTLNARTN